MTEKLTIMINVKRVTFVKIVVGNDIVKIL